MIGGLNFRVCEPWEEKLFGKGLVPEKRRLSVSEQSLSQISFKESQPTTHWTRGNHNRSLVLAALPPLPLQNLHHDISRREELEENDGIWLPLHRAS
jgi:hypothetical protein